MTGSALPPTFRLAYVPGVTPGKWVKVWNERLPEVPLTLVPVAPGEADGVLRDGTADAALARTPVDRERFMAIPLYTETTVVVVPNDHLFTAAEEVAAADLADEIVLHPLDDVLGWEVPPGRPAFERPATTADAVELVAAGIGVLAVPQSLARLHHRRDLTFRTLNDVPASSVAFAWPAADEAPELVEEFIGIIRGRTVNSTRGRKPPAAEPSGGSRGASGGSRGGTGSRGRAGGSRGGAGGSRGGAGGRRSSGGGRSRRG